MKKKLIILLTVAVCHIGVITELIAQARTSISDIALMKPGNTSQGLVLGDSTTKALQVLGKPTGINDEYFEIGEVIAKVHTYGANKLYFINDKLSSFHIVNASIMVGQTYGPTFKIGDKIKVKTNRIPIGPPQDNRFKRETVRSFFDFPLTTKPGTSRGISYKTISISYLKNNTINLDSGLELLFNTNDELIDIHVQE